MSTHASAELLSAYLDRQLVEPEARQLEDHLDRCSECHVRLEGLRKVVDSLKSAEQLATPLSLEQTVARRIALSDQRPSLLDHFEHGMSIFNRQSPILATFGVVIALALFIYLFSYTLHLRENATMPVIWEDPPSAAPATPELVQGSRLEVAGRRLVWSAEGLWVEEGIDVEPSRTVELDSDDGRALLEAHPELSGLADLDRAIVLRIDGEAVRLE